MDIRIGNDIRVDVAMSEIAMCPPDSIIKTVGKFINISNTDKKGSFSKFKCSSEYSVRGYDIPIYNTLPCNNVKNIEQCRSHGHCVYEDWNSPAKTDEQGEYILSYFPASLQKQLGEYIFTLEVWIRDEMWKGGIRKYTIPCGTQFNLVLDGVSGTQVIQVADIFEPDLFISLISVPELEAIEENYVQLMMNSAKYSVATIPNDGIVLHVDLDDKIVMIGMTDKLSMMYNGLLIPMEILKISDTHYLYTSSYTYDQNNIRVKIITNQEVIYDYRLPNVN